MSTRPTVALLVTCLVDLIRPRVGFAAVKLLEDAGCEVHVPKVQTCCGQPAWNAGDNADARAIARGLIAAFEPYDYVVAPSGSCAGMVARHYPELLDGEWAARARALAGRTHELVGFLTDVMGVERVSAAFDGTVTYHDSCSSLRECGVRDQPRWLLAHVEGLRLEEMAGTEECCGFGGTFCVKYPDISGEMVAGKTASITATGARAVLAGDLGCLMNIAGKLSREGSDIEVRHVAEVLAGMADGPAIGKPDRRG